MMEKISTNDAADEELELEDLWSELHSLKKLYGLLQTNNAKIPNEDNGLHGLDDKSKVVLKKLLDGATHQALQSQAKIVCYTPEKIEKTEPKTSVSTEVRGDGDELQESHPVPAPQCNQESAQSSSAPVVEGTAGKPKDEPECIRPVDEPKAGRKPHPSSHNGHLTRQNSRTSVAVSDQRSTLDHRRRGHHQQRHPPIHHRGRKPSMNNNAEKQDQRIKNDDERLAIVPAEKRARVEPTGQSQRNRTRVVGPVDRELTHSKRGDAEERPRRGRSGGGPSSRPPSRLGSVKDGESKSIARGGRAPSRPVSNLREREGEGTATRGRDLTAAEIGRRPPAVPSRMRYIACSSPSSSSQTLRSESLASSTSTSRHHRVARRRVGPARPPRRMPSRRKIDVGPPPPPKREMGSKGEGRLKRFADKLAVIFHHHHHHHHHIHGGGGGHAEEAEGGGAHRHRSPWSYLKGVVHHTGGQRKGRGEGREIVKAPARAPAQRQHGYLYALLDGLVRHVRGMRRRKKGAKGGMTKVGGRKKSHWWQRFRRRGGVRLASKKKPRLRLGFNRAHSRNNRNKKSV